VLIKYIFWLVMVLDTCVSWMAEQVWPFSATHSPHHMCALRQKVETHLMVLPSLDIHADGWWLYTCIPHGLLYQQNEKCQNLVEVLYDTYCSTP
jgi:hypothetical protein